MSILPDPFDEHDDDPFRRFVVVYATRVRLKDKPALKKLLAPIPDGERLRFRLKNVCTAHHWDAMRHIDYWVFSNARNIVCLEIQGLDVREIERSRQLFAERCRRAGHGRIAWIESILREATNMPSTVH